MKPERLAEITAADPKFDLIPNPNGVYAHRRELLAYVDKLRAEVNKLAAALAEAWTDTEQARQIARALVHHNLGLHDAAIECEVHLNLDALPDWLTAAVPADAEDATQP